MFTKIKSFVSPKNEETCNKELEELGKIRTQFIQDSDQSKKYFDQIFAKCSEFLNENIVQKTQLESLKSREEEFMKTLERNKELNEILNSNYISHFPTTTPGEAKTKIISSSKEKEQEKTIISLRNQVEELRCNLQQKDSSAISAQNQATYWKNKCQKKKMKNKELKKSIEAIQKSIESGDLFENWLLEGHKRGLASFLEETLSLIQRFESVNLAKDVAEEVKNIVKVPKLVNEKLKEIVAKIAAQERKNIYLEKQMVGLYRKGDDQDMENEEKRKLFEEKKKLEENLESLKFRTIKAERELEESNREKIRELALKIVKCVGLGDKLLFVPEDSEKYLIDFLTWLKSRTYFPKNIQKEFETWNQKKDKGKASVNLKTTSMNLGEKEEEEKRELGFNSLSKSTVNFKLNPDQRENKIIKPMQKD